MAKIRDDLSGVVLAFNQRGGVFTLAAGDDVPDGVTVGAHVLADAPEVKPKKTPKKSEAPTLSAPVVPPKAGPRSGVETWRTYAIEAAAEKGFKIDIPDDAKRDEIIDALADAGIPTE